MSILMIMIPISLVLGFSFLIWFFWAVENDQWSNLKESSYLVLEERDLENEK